MAPRSGDYIHCYKLGGHNIVLDIASGAVHSVDEVTYDIIRLYGQLLPAQGGVGVALDGAKPEHEQIIEQIMQRHPNVSETDIRAALVDVEKLISDGKLFSPDVFAPVAENKSESASGGIRPHIKALCLNVSHACNMKCAYCFASSSLQAADGGEAESAPALMPLDTGKKAIDFLLENSGATRQLDIDFFGGEPLLNWQTVKDIVAYARSLEKGSGKKFRFTLTTNGLLIDDDVIAFTNREFHNVVLSLDGRKETHDNMRKLSADTLASAGEGGKPPIKMGSYDKVLPNIKRMVEARRGKGYYIRGTFTRANMDFCSDILHLADELGFRELSLEPAVSRVNGGDGSGTGPCGSALAFAKADLPELFRQYDILAIEMQRRAVSAKYLREQDIPDADKQFRFYHFNIDITGGPCIYKRIKGCGVATEYLAVTPGGELYPCHQFIGDNAFKLGDVESGVTNRALQTEFAKVSIYSREQCRSCWARFYCSGGCAANAYHATGDINGVYEVGCELFKKRIENAIMLQFC